MCGVSVERQTNRSEDSEMWGLLSDTEAAENHRQ